MRRLNIVSRWEKALCPKIGNDEGGVDYATLGGNDACAQSPWFLRKYL